MHLFLNDEQLPFVWEIRKRRKNPEPGRVSAGRTSFRRSAPQLLLPLIAIVRIAAAASEAALYAETNPDRDSENEKAGPMGPALFLLVAGA